jgi:hypothetical protein
MTVKHPLEAADKIRLVRVVYLAVAIMRIRNPTLGKPPIRVPVIEVLHKTQLASQGVLVAAQPFGHLISLLSFLISGSDWLFFLLVNRTKIIGKSMI